MTARSRQPVRIASSLDLRPDPGFERRADVLRSGQDPTALQQVRVLTRILRKGVRRRPMVLYSSWGALKPDLLACVLMSYWPASARPPVVLVGEMWQPTSGWRSVVERWMVRRADRAVDGFLVPSRAEAALLPQTWPVTPGKVQACAFYFFPQQHGLTSVPTTRGDDVFAGGDSFRDYAPLLEAARRLPDVRFRLATRQYRPDDPALPPNVSVENVRYAEYPRLMEEAGAVVVPLQRDLRRSAGMLTYLMAMWLGKPTIVSDSVAVREYVEDGVSGLVVDGSAESYARAVAWVLEPANEGHVDAMGAAAHRLVNTEYRWDQYVSRIMAALDTATQTRVRRPRRG